MYLEVFNTLKLIQAKELNGESNYDHIELLIQLKEQLEACQTGNNSEEENVSNTVPIQFLGLNSVGDDVFLLLPNSQFVEVNHCGSAIEFSHKVEVGGEPIYTLVCDL